MTTLFLAWQDPTSRRWFPIGRLETSTGQYSFSYIKGVLEAQGSSNFQALPSFPDIHQIYESEELFPLFSNRIMRPSRPDYLEYLECLNISDNADDPIAILSRSGGKKATDHFEVFPCPESDRNGLYHIHFFLHGLRHRPSSAIQRVDNLKACEKLSLMHDVQNSHDSMALALRTDDYHVIGFCPRYIVPDIHKLLAKTPDLVNIHVERVNPAPTPIQLRLLCSITAQWPSDFRPFSSDEYQPLTNNRVGTHL